MSTKVYTSMCEEETFGLGCELALRLHPGDIVAMYGDLGSGKTEFIKGICSGLHVEDLISSPTFTIVNEYTGRTGDGSELCIHHIDLYRLDNEKEIREIGLSEILSEEDSIKLVEWSENAGSLLPSVEFEVRLTSLEEEENGRKIVVIAADNANAPVRPV